MYFMGQTCTGRIESSPFGPGGFCEDDMAGATEERAALGIGTPSYIECIIEVIGIVCIYRRIRIVLVSQSIVVCGGCVLVVQESDDDSSKSALVHCKHS